MSRAGLEALLEGRGSVRGSWLAPLSGLRLRLVLLVFVAAAPALGLVAYALREQRVAAIAAAQQLATSITRLAADEQGHVLNQARSLLVTLAQLPQATVGDEAACYRALAAVLDVNPIYLNVGAIAPDGRLLCSAVRPSGEINLADRSYFERALAVGEFVVGDYQVGRVTGKPSINAAYPMVRDGRISAVLFVAIDLEALTRMVAAAGLPEGASLVVSDERGTVLVAHPPSTSPVSTRAPMPPDGAGGPRVGLAQALAGGGERQLFTSTTIGEGAHGRLYLTVGTPADAASGEVNRILRWSLVGLFVVTVLTMGAAWLCADLFVLKRVRQLVDATQRIAAGNLGVRLGGPYRGEFGQLARAFNHTAAVLAQRERQLTDTAEALRASSQRLSALVEASPLAIAAYDEQGRVTVWNPAAERMFGWRGAEVLGRPSPLLDGGEAELRDQCQRALAGEILAGAEARCSTRDGRSIDVSISSAPIPPAHGNAASVLVMYADLTEKKRVERQVQRQQETLFRTEKLAELGRLAAGVAHELKNPLTVIDGRTQLMEHEVRALSRALAEPLERHLASVADAVERMRRIMLGLSNYSRPTRPEPMALRVADLLSAVGELVAYQARDNGVEVVLDAGPPEATVVAERSQMLQILVNLATNAIEAMARQGGRLILRSRRESRDSGPARLLVEVEDTGPGIPAEVLSRIWEPFYTTKSEGTGLGLSIVRSLVSEQPGAAIEVESRAGVGTTFRLTMPAA